MLSTFIGIGLDVDILYLLLLLDRFGVFNPGIFIHLGKIYI